MILIINTMLHFPMIEQQSATVANKTAPSYERTNVLVVKRLQRFCSIGPIDSIIIDACFIQMLLYIHPILFCNC